ncbi:MAG TPA: hypothetical protein DDX06_08055 [Curvibacter sp.]|nr:hypothetical protein [Curvibacter sp.]
MAIIALVLSNIITVRLYLGLRDQAVASGVRQGQATATALQCSEGTEKLEQQAQVRQHAAQPKIDAAAEAARQRHAEAQRILSAPAAVPGDACASADALIGAWWGAQP